MIAIATLLVAVLAIWGFAALREEASNRAAREARRVALPMIRAARREAIEAAREAAGPIAARTARDAIFVGTPGNVSTSRNEADEIANAMDGNQNETKDISDA